MKVKELYKEWQENTSIGDRTQKEYENIWEARILPLYGHMNAKDLKPIHISNFVKSLQKDGARLDGKKGKLSTSTINNCYKAFNSVLKFGVDMTWLASNPADNINPPTVQHAETDIYTPKEISILIKGLEKLVTLEKRTLVAIALSTSARQGEIVALEEKHCDFERDGIHVKQALIIKKDVGVVLKETKNKSDSFHYQKL
ncbi:integrase [Gracilibacillus alcaliphilus]|nr:integrase [Gracilibacillus alcaliphilus]